MIKTLKSKMTFENAFGTKVTIMKVEDGVVTYCISITTFDSDYRCDPEESCLKMLNENKYTLC